MSPRLLALLRANRLHGRDDADALAACTALSPWRATRVGYGCGCGQWRSVTP
jgi:hypothetical protein